MTYKAIVSNLVSDATREWVKAVLKENRVEYKWVYASTPKIDKYDSYTGYMWETRAQIYFDGRPTATVIVGGTVDDLVGICCSVMWDESKTETLWMSVEDTRQFLGITELKIA